MPETNNTPNGSMNGKTAEFDINSLVSTRIAVKEEKPKVVVKSVRIRRPNDTEFFMTHPSEVFDKPFSLIAWEGEFFIVAPHGVPVAGVQKTTIRTLTVKGEEENERLRPRMPWK
jgi:hypothetical protein